ncbi:hypothetical protein D621_08280 [beta proteobacterium AAP51]|nr:hypothetical protein D621_08280 [beta proteobacterium AAP51]
MSGSNSSAPRADLPGASPPPEAVALTVHSMPGPELHDPAATSPASVRMGRLKMLAVLLVCASPVIASYLTYFVIRPEGRTNYSTLMQPTRSMPADLNLRTLEGTPVTPQQLRGQWLMVNVGPAACDTDCEQRLFMQRQLREMVGRERDRLDKVWLITDEASLTPALREAMGGKAPVTLLRADAAAVARWLQPESGHQLQEHLYIVDPMGEWMMRVPAKPEPSRVMRDISRVLRASSFWDQPGRGS